MHEGKIAEYVFDLVKETISDDDELKGKKVKKLFFSMSHPYTVYPDSFEFYFFELIKGTELEGLTIEYEELDPLEKSGFYLTSIEVFD
jgi:Zn finger protein HypA/HybF involved in hydrogenase expression